MQYKEKGQKSSIQESKASCICVNHLRFYGQKPQKLQKLVLNSI